MSGGVFPFLHITWPRIASTARASANGNERTPQFGKGKCLLIAAPPSLSEGIPCCVLREKGTMQEKGDPAKSKQLVSEFLLPADWDGRKCTRSIQDKADEGVRNGLTCSHRRRRIASTRRSHIIYDFYLFSPFWFNLAQSNEYVLRSDVGWRIPRW